MTGLKRTAYCAEFSRNDIGKTVVVAGFVQKIRNLGRHIGINWLYDIP